MLQIFWGVLIFGTVLATVGITGRNSARVSREQ